MLCIGCGIERQTKDFLLNQIKCYKCTYKEKTHNNEKKRICKWCKEEFKFGRKLYCSPECAQKSQDYMSANAWFRNKKT